MSSFTKILTALLILILSVTFLVNFDNINTNTLKDSHPDTQKNTTLQDRNRNRSHSQEKVGSIQYNQDKLNSTSTDIEQQMTNNPKNKLLNEEHSLPENFLNRALKSDPPLFSLSPVMDGSTLSTENIPNIFIDNADRFSADISEIHHYPIGETVNIEIFGQLIQADIKRHKTLPHGITNTRIEFGHNSPPHYMTIYTRSDGSSKGKIYTDSANYIFIHNGETGYLIETNKLHRLEGSPITE